MKRALNNNFIHYLIAQLCVFVIGIIKVPVFTSLFDPEALGSYSLVVAILSYIEIIFLSWISSTFWRHIYENALIKDFTHFISLAAPLFAFVLLIGFLVVLAIAFYFKSNSAIYPILITGYLSIISQQAITFYFLYLQSIRQLKKWSLLYLLQQTCAFLLFVVMAVTLQIGVVSIFLGSLATNIVFLLILVYRYRSNVLQTLPRTEITLYKKFVLYSFLALTANLLLMILNNADRFLLYFLRGSRDVGLYSQSYSLASVGFAAAMQAFNAIFLPFYNKSVVNPGEQNNTGPIIKLYLMLFTPIMLLLILHSATITNMFLAPSYRGLHLVFAWVVAGVYCYGCANFFEIRLKLSNRIALVNVTLLAVALSNIVCNFLGISLIGITAPAVITFASYFGLLAIFILFNLKMIKQMYFNSLILHIILANGGVLLLHQFISISYPGIHDWVLLSIDAIGATITNLILLKRHRDVIQHCFKLIR